MEGRIDASAIRVHFTARQLVQWARTLGNYEVTRCYAESISWYPDFWLHWSHKKLFIVNRLVLHSVTARLLAAVPPSSVQWFHVVGIFFALEGLTEEEQSLLPKILEEYYGLS